MARVRTPLLLVALLMGLSPAFTACGPRAEPGSVETSSGAPRIGGPFRLVNQDNQPVDQSLLHGKWTAVFFGYTFCPDVCPTTLALLGRVQSMLGPRASALQVVFISVDPERDTPAQLKTYLSSPVFPKGAVGLTGAPAQVDAAAKAYKAYYQKAGSGAAYTVDHTALIYLMDPHGKFDRVLAESLTPDQMSHQITEAMSQGPRTGG